MDEHADRPSAPATEGRPDPSSTNQDRGRRFRRRRLWPVDIGVAVFVIMLLTYLLWPIWSSRTYQPEPGVANSLQATLAQRMADKRVPAGQVMTAATEYTVTPDSTPLVSIAFTLAAVQDFVGRSDGSPTPKDASPKISVVGVTRRIDWGVLLLLLVLAVSVVGIRLFFFRGPGLGAPAPDADGRFRSRRYELPDDDVAQQGGPPAEACMRGELRLLEHDMSEMLTRSRYSLGGALVMAFVSIAVFFLAQGWIAPHAMDSHSPLLLGEASGDAGHAARGAGSAQAGGESVPNSWLAFAEMSRPFLILVVLDAIVIFFLREYRASIEDYKALYRVYLKRSAYLTAFKVLETSAAGPTTIGAALINDDPSLTTASAASSDAAVGNPLPDLLKVLFDQLRPQG